MIARRLRFPVELVFVLPLLLAAVLIFDVPLAMMFGWSFLEPEPTLEHYRKLIETPLYLRIIDNTFRIAAVTTLVCVLLGYPLAYWMRGLTSRRRLIIIALVVLPFWVSILVRTYAWIVILGNNGVVNRLLSWMRITEDSVSFLYNYLGVTIGTVNVLLPFVVLPLFAAMVKIDNRLLEAAASLGASKRVVFWRIFFPLTVPALAAGAILVFILTIGFFITPAILGGGRVSMIANIMDILINRVSRWELASAVSTVLLSITLVCYAGYRWVQNRAYA
jgi:ABC-type spermidine/putrescine transport system permease subunit I